MSRASRLLTGIATTRSTMLAALLTGAHALRRWVIDDFPGDSAAWGATIQWTYPPPWSHERLVAPGRSSHRQ